MLPWVLLGSMAAVGYVGVRSYRLIRTGLVPRHWPLDPSIEASGIEDLRAVAIPNSGSLVHGWYRPTRNGATIVLLHGSHADRTHMLLEARALARAGFGLLLFDWPGHAETPGPIEVGGSERRALAAALDWLAARPEEVGNIGGLGVSMGAFILGQVAPGDDRVKAAVLVSPPHDLRDQVLYEYKRWGPISQYPALWAAKRCGVGFDDPSPLRLLPGFAPRPLLLVAGGLDRVVPPSAARALCTAAGPAAELWLVPSAGHVNFGEVVPLEYPQRLVEFFSKTLVGAS